MCTVAACVRVSDLECKQFVPPPTLQAYIPLVTVLLAISEQHFFLNHWYTFLSQVVVPNIRVSTYMYMQQSASTCSGLDYSFQAY